PGWSEYDCPEAVNGDSGRAPADVVNRGMRTPAASTSPASSRRWAGRLTEAHFVTAGRTGRKTPWTGKRKQTRELASDRSRPPEGRARLPLFLLSARAGGVRPTARRPRERP